MSFSYLEIFLLNILNFCMRQIILVALCNTVACKVKQFNVQEKSVFNYPSYWPPNQNDWRRKSHLWHVKRSASPNGELQASFEQAGFKTRRRTSNLAWTPNHLQCGCFASRIQAINSSQRIAL